MIQITFCKYCTMQSSLNDLLMVESQTCKYASLSSSSQATKSFSKKVFSLFSCLYNWKSVDYRCWSGGFNHEVITLVLCWLKQLWSQGIFWYQILNAYKNPKRMLCLNSNHTYQRNYTKWILSNQVLASLNKTYFCLSTHCSNHESRL